MASTAVRRPRVFLSYAWEDDSYKDWVWSLASELVQAGLNVRLDRWHLKGQTTISEFMDSEVRNADWIVVLCSPKYRQKIDAMEDGKSTSGSGWEAMLVRSSLFQGTRSRETVVPVLALGTWAEAAPTFLQDVPYFNLTDRPTFQPQYKALLRRLYLREDEPPPPGEPPQDLDPKPPPPLNGPAPAGATHRRRLATIVLLLVLALALFLPMAFPTCPDEKFSVPSSNRELEALAATLSNRGSCGAQLLVRLLADETHSDTVSRDILSKAIVHIGTPARSHVRAALSAGIQDLRDFPPTESRARYLADLMLIGSSAGFDRLTFWDTIGPRNDFQRLLASYLFTVSQLGKPPGEPVTDLREATGAALRILIRLKYPLPSLPLTDLPLSEESLAEGNFTGTNLSRTDLRYSSLVAAALKGAIVTDTKLDGAVLSEDWSAGGTSDSDREVILRQRFGCLRGANVSADVQRLLQRMPECSH